VRFTYVNIFFCIWLDFTKTAVMVYFYFFSIISKNFILICIYVWCFFYFLKFLKLSIQFSQNFSKFYHFIMPKNAISTVTTTTTTRKPRVKNANTARVKNKSQRNRLSTTNIMRLQPAQIRASVQQATMKAPLNITSVYARVMANPFDIACAGAKIPDPFPVFTDTYKITGTFSLTSNASGTSGGIMLRPSPYFSVVNGAVGTSNRSILVGAPTAFTSNSFLYYASSPTTTFTNFRVVTAGFKISALMPPLTRTGNLYIAPIPCANVQFNFTSLNANALTSTADAGGMYSDGINATSIVSSQILQYPGAIKISLNELGNQVVLLCDRPTSYRYCDFRDTNESGAFNATLSEGDYVVSTATTSQSYSSAVTSSPGHTSFVVAYDGVPSATAIFEVEYIYHLEATPIVSSTGSTVPSSPDFGVQSSHTWDQVIPQLSKTGIHIVDLVKEYGPDVMNTYSAMSQVLKGIGSAKLIGY
jgi:hypothetical protein